MNARLKPMCSMGVELRWLNVQCYEIKLPGGKTILFDPQISDPNPLDNRARYYKIPEQYKINQESVEQVDYIIINHSHCDHIIDLGYYVKKFNPIVICHECVAYELAKSFDIPFTSICPVSDRQSYDFADFTLHTCLGSHMPQDFVYSTMPNILKQSYLRDGDGTKEIGHLGGLFNMNYMITTKENFKIAFFAGRMDNLSHAGLKYMASLKPNLLLRQIPARLPDNPSDIFAEEIEILGAQMMLPMHHESFDIEKPVFLEELFEKINQQLNADNFSGRAYLPVRGKWYQIGLYIK